MEEQEINIVIENGEVKVVKPKDKETVLQLQLPDSLEPIPFISAVDSPSAERAKISEKWIINADDLQFFKLLGKGAFAKVYLADYKGKVWIINFHRNC